MIIHVTQADIDSGSKHSCRFCPVARAVAREYCGCDILQDELGYVAQVDKNYWVPWIHLPRSVARFINRFDEGKPVKPFNFKMPV